MTYEWITYPHPYTLIHDTSVTSVLKAYLMELNNVPPPVTNIHHTSIGLSHTLEIIPKAQGCTSGSSSSPQGILVMEQCPDYTNVLFQDAQDPWEDFQSFLHTENPHYTVTNPDSLAASTSQHMSVADEDKNISAVLGRSTGEIPSCQKPTFTSHHMSAANEDKYQQVEAYPQVFGKIV